MVHQVLTLQFGGFANCVGAHFWNFQDELAGHAENSSLSSQIARQVDWNVLYTESSSWRSRSTVAGDAFFLPRLVAFDVMGSLGSLPQSGNASQVQQWRGGLDDDGSPSPHSSAVERFQRETVELTEFQKLLQGEQHKPEEQEQAHVAGDRNEDDEMEMSEMERAALLLGAQSHFWTDYYKGFVGPKNIFLLPGVWKRMDGDGNGGSVQLSQDDDSFGDGQLLLSSSLDLRETIQDKIRVQAEDCDRLDGFNCIVDMESRFAGIASGQLEHIQDEYSRAGVLCTAVQPPGFHEENENIKSTSDAGAKRKLGKCLQLAMMPHKSDAFVIADRKPSREQELQCIVQAMNSDYTHSALPAVALETLSIPFRIRSLGGSGGDDRMGLRDLCHAIRTGRPSSSLLAAAASFPMDLPEFDSSSVLRGLRPLTSFGLGPRPPRHSTQGRTTIATTTKRKKRRSGWSSQEEFPWYFARYHSPLTTGNVTLDLKTRIGQEHHEKFQTRSFTYVNHLPIAVPLTLPMREEADFDARIPEGSHSFSYTTNARTRRMKRAFSSSLVKIWSADGFRPLLSECRTYLRESRRTGQGANILRCWGLESTDLDEIDEALASEEDTFGGEKYQAQGYRTCDSADENGGYDYYDDDDDDEEE